jgi:hypothetical protein
MNIKHLLVQAKRIQTLRYPHRPSKDITQTPTLFETT